MPAGETPPVDIQVARFIREEIREAVKDEIREATGAPPLYVSTDATPKPVPAKKDVDIEARPVSAGKDVAKPKKTIKQRIAYVMIWLPVIVWIVAVAVLAGLKVLPYDIVPLAAIFMVITDGSLFFFMILICVNSPENPESTDADDDLITQLGCLVTWHFLLCTILFTVILWAWFLHGPNSVLGPAQLVADFQSRIDISDGLQKLTDCLGAAVPAGRNAKMMDFEACLGAMGM